jgi:molybdopterin molybdotransferase
MTVLHKTDAGRHGCDAPERVKTLISIDDALRQIAEHVDAINGAERLPIAQARGRILAEPVRACDMAPPFDNAAMDGFAIACTTLTGAGPWTLPVVDRVPAGQVGKRDVSDAAAVRIFTGAPVPAGADAVIMQENVHQLRQRIVIDHRPTPGTNIRRAGEDLMTGQSVLQVGQCLTVPSRMIT